MTGNVAWSELTFIIGLVSAVIVAVAAGVGGALLWLWSKHNKIYQAINDVQLEFVNVRLEMSKEYVTIRALDKVTEQMDKAIDRLGARLETALRALGIPISPVEK